MTRADILAAREAQDAAERKRQSEVMKKVRRIKREMAAGKHAPRPMPEPEPEHDPDRPDGWYCPTAEQIRAEARRIRDEALAGAAGARRIKNYGVPLHPREFKVYRDPRRYV